MFSRIIHNHRRRQRVPEHEHAFPGAGMGYQGFEQTLAISAERLEHLRAPEISLDKNQMEQVFVNLLKNAAEAVGEDGAVTLRLGGEPRRSWVEIEDTGCGIPAAAREQLFTPFFTTKDNGCGLGLTVVKEILARHGFGISLENPEGRPTRFRLVVSRW